MSYMKFENVECEDIKQDCPWEGTPSSLGPNGPIMCEGAYCRIAYDRWVEEHVVTCECCGKQVDKDICSIQTDDCHKYYLCEDCEATAE